MFAPKNFFARTLLIACASVSGFAPPKNSMASSILTRHCKTRRIRRA